MEPTVACSSNGQQRELEEDSLSPCLLRAQACNFGAYDVKSLTEALGLLWSCLRNACKAPGGRKGKQPDSQRCMAVRSSTAPRVGDQDLCACNKAEGEGSFHSFHLNSSNSHVIDIFQ